MTDQSELIETLQGNVDYLQGQLDIEIAEKKKLQAELLKQDKATISYLAVIEKYNNRVHELMNEQAAEVNDIIEKFNKH